MNRRTFISWLCATPIAGLCVSSALAKDELVSDRIRGMLVGGLIGDALGGPVEFADADRVKEILPNARRWDEGRRIDEATLGKLASTLPLFSYEKLRPDTAPYGPWVEKAPAGTLTDDSRHKIALMRTIVARKDASRITVEDLARQYVSFTPIAGREPTGKLKSLCDEGFDEYRMAARWILGERDESKALPVERLWGGIANCSGQMMMPPLAAAYLGEPEAAYRASFELNFVDSPMARDFCAAMIAGLAKVLDPEFDQAPLKKRWDVLLETIRNTDPFRINKVPFAGRPLHRWLNLAKDLAKRADGRPSKLYRLLENDGKPVYWWDAHFTLLVPLAMLYFCDFNVLSALHLTLDFGHDTDSYAQVLGVLGGAVCGASVFPGEMREAVARTLKSDYDESIDSWIDAL